MPNLTAYEDGVKSAVTLGMLIDAAGRTADLHAAQVAALVLSDELDMALKLAYLWDEARSEADSLTEQRRKVIGEMESILGDSQETGMG